MNDAVNLCELAAFVVFSLFISRSIDVAFMDFYKGKVDF